METPPRIPPRITSAPKIRNMYWCDFPEDAHLPEFWKTRPVIVVSRKNYLSGAVTVIPCSTDVGNSRNKWAVKLQTTIDDRDGWAICDKVTTLAVSRLTPDKKRGVVRVTQAELEAMMDIVLRWLPNGGGG